jgi:nicotinate-nucleotide adenylyltransferase
VALYGGSFDPPHNAHLALCLFAAELLLPDRLLISVSNNPFKRRYAAADVHRKRMARLLADELVGVGIVAEVSGWELEKKQPSYTVDLVRYVRSIYPYDRLTLLIGEDSYREITTWKSWESLPSLCNLAIFGRSGSAEGSHAQQVAFAEGAVRFIEFDYPVSSTQIRETIAAGHTVSGLVPSSIRHYIAEHGLYGSA